MPNLEVNKTYSSTFSKNLIQRVDHNEIKIQQKNINDIQNDERVPIATFNSNERLMRNQSSPID